MENMEKEIVYCDWCKAKMRWVTGVNCFAERYERFECPSCGNARMTYSSLDREPRTRTQSRTFNEEQVK